MSYDDDITTGHEETVPFPPAPQAYRPAAPPQPPAHQEPAPAAPEKRGWSGGAVIAAAVAGSVIGGVLMAAAMLLLYGLPALQSSTSRDGTPAAPLTRTAAPAVSSRLASGTEEPIQAVAEKVTPSVVNISVEEETTHPFTGVTRTQVTGNGSGVIIREDGYVLTNYHVINGASRVLVTIGLDELPAKVVGTDASSDLAVVKVEKTGLTAATLGDSESLKVGQTVVAIGSPFGLDKTVTSGIISALHRTGEAADQTQQTIYANLIQTDASINPGNSGGALADLQGNIIGVNTLIQTGGAQQSAGIGFAIPSKLAKQVADQLIKTGKATHTFLGVAAVDVNEYNAGQLGVQSTSGALIQEITPDSPAKKAGLQRGDVILKVAGTTVEGSQDLVAAVRGQEPGAEVEIVVERDGKRQTLKAVLGSTSS